MECWNSGILGFGNLEDRFYWQKSITKRLINWTLGRGKRGLICSTYFAYFRFKVSLTAGVEVEKIRWVTLSEIFLISKSNIKIQVITYSGYAYKADTLIKILDIIMKPET